MRKKYKIMDHIYDMNLLDNILMSILKKYTYKVYKSGFMQGFQYNENEGNELYMDLIRKKNKLSTICPRKIKYNKIK